MQLEKKYKFIFALTIWSHKFCDYFLNYCLPALLAPGNIPSLRDKSEHVIFIVCPLVDKEYMLNHKITSEALKYVTFNWVDIEIPDNANKYKLLTDGHLAAVKYAREMKGQLCFLTPDLILSDYTLSKLQRHLDNGMKAVLAPALRFGEEPLLRNLSLDIKSKNTDENRTDHLSINSRTLAQAGINSLHREALNYNWENNALPNLPSACYWHNKKTSSVVSLYSLSWAIMVMDYQKVSSTEADIALEEWTTDGDYAYRCLNDLSDVYIVKDSDEMIQVSWAPMDEGEINNEPKLIQSIPAIGYFYKGIILRSAIKTDMFDPLKRMLVQEAVVWHGSNLIDEDYIFVDRCSKVISLFLSDLLFDFNKRNLNIIKTTWFFMLDIFVVTHRSINLIKDLWGHKGVVVNNLVKLILLDKTMRARFFERLRIYKNSIMGINPRANFSSKKNK